RAASLPRQRRTGARTERHSSLATGASSQHERRHSRPAPKSPLLLLTANVGAKAEAIGKTILRARDGVVKLSHACERVFSGPDYRGLRPNGLARAGTTGPR